MYKTKRKDLYQARKFSKTFQFIDDPAVFNDGGEFEKVYHEIYPPVLKLKLERRSETESSFLDLDSKIVNKNISFSFL